MIFISSHRPLGGGEVSVNQISANESWQKVADHIVLFGCEEQKLNSPIVSFIPSEEWPPIFMLMEMAARLNDWCAILNADIVVSQEFAAVEKKLREKKASCAVSYRYQFDPTNPVAEKKVVDNGLDIFCAVPEVWRHAAKEIPRDFRIGHQRWDTWMIGFLNTHYFQSFYDFTASKTIFHPKHESRKFGHEIKGQIPFEPTAFSMPVKL